MKEKQRRDKKGTVKDHDVMSHEVNVIKRVPVLMCPEHDRVRLATRECVSAMLATDWLAA